MPHPRFETGKLLAWLLLQRHTLSLRMVSFPLFQSGYITAQWRSAAMKTRVNTEQIPPTHAKFPPVSSMHKTFPVTPSGWVVM